MPEIKTYLEAVKGVAASDFIADIPMASGNEKTGYPTQKPLELYKRIIRVSSNPGDMVLDPFCGCATTSIAAEQLGRQWIGMDIWDGALTQVLDRLEQEGLLTKGAHRKEGQQRLLTSDVHYLNKHPKRTDGGRMVADPLPRIVRTGSSAKPRMSSMTREEKIEVVSKRTAGVLRCDGCGFRPPMNDRRYLELDHITPRSKGGKDEPSNWTLSVWALQ